MHWGEVESVLYGHELPLLPIFFLVARCLVIFFKMISYIKFLLFSCSDEKCKNTPEYMYMYMFETSPVDR